LFLIWPGEDFLEINQAETRIAFGSHVCQRIGTTLAIFIKDFPRMKTWWEAPMGGSVLNFLKAE
jgi:hypothetical protein